MLQSRKWLLLSLTPLLPLLGVAVAMRTSPEVKVWLKTVHDVPLYLAIATVLLMFWVFYTSVKWWQNADEAVQEAHKWAWFWGGLVGLCLIVLPLILSVGLTRGQAYEIFKTTLHIMPGFGEFAAGIVTALLAMLAGYAVAWAIWWRKHA
jgi:hypothetical protein